MTHPLVTKALTHALAFATVLLTSDGYTFRRDGGTWTDGDMTYPTLGHLLDATEGEVQVVECERQQQSTNSVAVVGAISVDSLRLAALVRDIQNDVLARMQAGQLPRSIRSFGQLGDHCDENCLGGICDDKKFNALVAAFGGRDVDDGMPQGMLDLINAARDKINHWLGQRPWPGIKLRDDMVFTGAPGLVGSAWHNLGQAENELARALVEFPMGAAVVVDGHAWSLGLSASGLELRHGAYADGRLGDPTTRFEHELEWVDSGEEDIQSYIDQVREAIALPEVVMLIGEQAQGYINRGGIGLIANSLGELEGLAGNEMRTLNLRDASGKWIVHQMPSSPWTSDSIGIALEGAVELIEKYNPVNAFLGDVFLGSTEL